MNLERLRAVQAEEREADSLRALPDAFYREVADYIEELRAERARAADAAEDPFGSEEVRRLTDEVETAEEVAEAIYERRVGKLVKRASLAAAGMPADEEGLTAEEAELFSTLVDQIEAHREDVLATFDGERDGARGVEGERAGPAGEATGRTPDATDDANVSTPDSDGSTETASPGSGSTLRDDAESADGTSTDAPAAPPDEPAPDDVGESDGPGGPDVPEGDADDAEETTDGGDTERLTLRITRDVGEVFGVDERVYDLAAEDVVTLPAPNAKPLLERDAAEQID